VRLILSETNLTTAQTASVRAEGLEGVFSLYFSASWCPRCQETTPLLQDLISRQKRGIVPPFPVVFVTFERSEEAFYEYMAKHASSMFVPYGDPRVGTLADLYGVTTIPRMVVLNRTHVVDDNVDLSSLSDDVTVRGWTRSSEGSSRAPVHGTIVTVSSALIGAIEWVIRTVMAYT
jgi:thiol-disulfide isomerase/thioredoxin